MVSSRQAVVVALTALCTIFIVSRGHEQNFEPLSNLCLLCICEATSNCSKDSLAASCDEGDTCGLYALTQAYWEDAGKLKVPDNPYVSEDRNITTEFGLCAQEPRCAEASVQNYMIRYAQDCNGDGKIDCFDYASIHRLGGFGCRGTLDQAYSDKVQACSQAAGLLTKSVGFNI
uniref:lysozyme n=1 Tax=Timema cristinae TaxID=61476 RepID=A0A7R9CJN9_TIMCR|nr:unnamed protein product [Timema cristinae]